MIYKENMYDIQRWIGVFYCPSIFSANRLLRRQDEEDESVFDFGGRHRI